MNEEFSKVFNLNSKNRSGRFSEHSWSSCLKVVGQKVSKLITFQKWSGSLLVKISLETVERGILEHYKYVEIKKFNPTFVSEKLKELYDVHLGKSQVGLYMSRTSWLKYNPAKKCYEVSLKYSIPFPRRARWLNIFQGRRWFWIFHWRNWRVQNW